MNVLNGDRSPCITVNFLKIFSCFPLVCWTFVGQCVVFFSHTEQNTGGKDDIYHAKKR